MKKLKAYNVQANEAGTVVFAAYSVVARREGANELNVDFEDIESCRRMPEVDHYVTQGFVPMRVLVEEHGWFAFCSWCEHRTFNDHEGRCWAGDYAFCCEEHRAKMIEQFPELKEEL